MSVAVYDVIDGVPYVSLSHWGMFPVSLVTIKPRPPYIFKPEKETK